MSTWDVARPDPAVARGLASALGLHPLVARVLAARGVEDPAAARAFLAPRLADLTRPDGMADRDAAAARIDRALQAGERIAVFGDYDVDGTTSAALLTCALRALGGDVVPLVASRFDGGYGLSDPAVARIVETGASLLITCDCGTSDHPRLATLRARGMDAIVVDHHKVPDEPLPALAFLNPQRPDCAFPFKGLASVGLALTVAAAVRARRSTPLDLRTFLDLVAVGTIADVAPLERDNRILTRAGLDRLAQGQGRPGLRALAREARLRARLRAHDVGFSIAPMLNAPGRLGAARPTLDLLLADNDTDAARLARELVAANEARRKISAELIEQATAQVGAVYGPTLPAGLVVGGDGWHPGVGGIVAGRLVERFGRPVMVIAFEQATGAGSARAPKGFALYQAVAACAREMEQFGGHDGAAGMRVRRERLDALRALFAEACARHATPAGTGGAPAVRADAELLEEDLTGPLADHLEALEPTGHAHPEPLVLVRNARIADTRPVGIGHLRARIAVGRVTVGAFVRDGATRRERGELALPERRPVDILGHLRPDPFAGPGAVQLDLVASRPAG